MKGKEGINILYLFCSQLTLQQASCENVYEKLYKNKLDSKTKYPIIIFCVFYKFNILVRNKIIQNPSFSVYYSVVIEG